MPLTSPEALQLTSTEQATVKNTFVLPIDGPVSAPFCNLNKS